MPDTFIILKSLPCPADAGGRLGFPQCPDWELLSSITREDPYR